MLTASEAKGVIVTLTLLDIPTDFSVEIVKSTFKVNPSLRPRQVDVDIITIKIYILTMKPISPILMKALSSIEGFGIDSKGYVKGSVDIDAAERVSYASNFFFESHKAYERFSNGATTRITLAPTDMPAKLFLEIAQFDVDMPNRSMSLEYGMTKDDKGEVLGWDEPYSLITALDGDFQESIQSAFVICSEEGEPAGYFSFALSFSRSSDFAYFLISLPLIYVRPQFRKATFALDLAIAVASFTSEVFSAVFKKYRGKPKIDIQLTADFESKGGERITNFIIEELECEIEMLKELYPNKAEKIGSLEANTGY